MAIIRTTACLDAIQNIIALYLFDLHFYPFLSVSLVGRNCSMCSYVIKSHDQKYCGTLCTYLNKCHRNVKIKTHNQKQHLSLYKEVVQ